MSRREAIKFVAIRSLGNFLVLFALYGVFVTFGPALYFEMQYRIAEARGVHFQATSSLEGKQSEEGEVRSNGMKEREIAQGDGKEGPSFWDVLAGSKEQIMIAPDTDFSIVIPKIGASAKVYPNVDPSGDVGAMSVLRHGVAHAKGTVFPGMGGNVYLFAHSAGNWLDAGRYNAVFYLLKDLSPGDEIVVFFEGTRYEYAVTSKFVADPTFVDLLRGEDGKDQLVLQTCWPPGTAWKRLFVTARPL